MPVARSDEGPSNVGHATRRRMIRKAPDVANAGPVTTAPPPVSAPRESTSTSAPAGTRLDDLYRMLMPKLFAYAEREGITEHTGMNRSQLIIAIVRRQIERGITVRGSGTLEVLPDGYGFLRS